MQGLDLYYCTGLTGKITGFVVSEGRTLSATRCPSYLTVSFFLVFAPPFEIGDIGKLVLPEGMQILNLNFCTGLTGKAKG